MVRVSFSKNGGKILAEKWVEISTKNEGKKRKRPGADPGTRLGHRGTPSATPVSNFAESPKIPLRVKKFSVDFYVDFLGVSLFRRLRLRISGVSRDRPPGGLNFNSTVHFSFLFYFFKVEILKTL